MRLAMPIVLSAAMALSATAFAGQVGDKRDAAKDQLNSAKRAFNQAGVSGQFKSNDQVNEGRAAAKSGDDSLKGANQAIKGQRWHRAKAMIAGAEALGAELSQSTEDAKQEGAAAAGLPELGLAALQSESFAEGDTRVSDGLAKVTETFQKARMAGRFSSPAEIADLQEKLGVVRSLLNLNRGRSSTVDPGGRGAALAGATALLRQVYRASTVKSPRQRLAQSGDLRADPGQSPGTPRADPCRLGKPTAQPPLSAVGQRAGTGASQRIGASTALRGISKAVKPGPCFGSASVPSWPPAADGTRPSHKISLKIH